MTVNDNNLRNKSLSNKLSVVSTAIKNEDNISPDNSPLKRNSTLLKKKTTIIFDNDNKDTSKLNSLSPNNKKFGKNMSF